jgi:glycosyltransferase involved in cell wall biosynthesis
MDALLTEAPTDTVAAAAPATLRVAYVMSRVPKLTETFILREILAMEALGHQVDVYPLIRERGALVQPGAAGVVERAVYLPFLSPAILASQLHWLRRRPRAYLGLVRDIIRGGWGSPNFLLGGLAILPKAAHAARLMTVRGTDHVHCHFANHPATAGLIVHRLTGLPFSFTAHGSDLHRDRHLLREKVLDAAFVVAISRFNAEIIAADAGDAARAKLHVIHCGVDPAEFRPAERPPAATFRITCIGTLHEVKGQTNLVDACRKLVERGVPVACELIGDGPDRAALEAQVRAAGLAGTVTFSGALPSDTVAARLRSTDVLVAPSVPSRDGRLEGIPVVLMEAMASGVTVVASRLSGIPELVEDGVSGLLVAPGDVDGLVAALATLWADPGLRGRLAACGREVVADGFDVARNAGTLARVMANAVAAGR